MKSKILFAILILLSFCQTQSYTESINNQFSPLTLDEHNEITSLIKKMSNFLNKTQKTEPSINNLKFLQKNNSEKSFMCKSCLSIYGHMYSFIMNKYSKKAIFYLLPLLCPSGINKEVCNEYLNLYGPVVYESVGNRFLNGEYICSISKICKKDHFIKLSAEKYAEDLLKDKPLNVTHPFIDIEAPTWKILHVSDLHIDDLYKEGSQTKCSETLCCRINSTSNTTTIDRAGKWGFIGKCDLPVRTLELFTNYVNKEIKPDFVLWTGDNAPHDTWTGSQKAAYNATQIFVDLISKNNNFSLPIYPTLGNHEIFPNDEYNPFDNNDKVFNRFAEIFKPWLSDEAYETFSKYGYYSQLHPNSNLRIVSTNCLLCDSINFNLIKNPTDPKDELKWLENTLRQSEQAGEVVYIISHIPIGDAFFLNECAKRHLAIIERFSHIIRGQFYGHTHNDEVKIARDYFNEEKITGVMFIAPSMTT
jgi:sphingomyelin phosphodiesterase